MTLNRQLLGRSYESGQTYEVGREKLREFARAIGANSPVHHSVEAAEAAGYPDIIAPPTFAIVVIARIGSNAHKDPELRLDMRVVVHGEQSFAHNRPIRAGDVLWAREEIVDITAQGEHEIVRVQTQLIDANDWTVCRAVTALVSRGTAKQLPQDIIHSLSQGVNDGGGVPGRHGRTR
jgi:acyl dehydratase